MNASIQYESHRHRKRNAIVGLSQDGQEIQSNSMAGLWHVYLKMNRNLFTMRPGSTSGAIKVSGMISMFMVNITIVPSRLTNK